MPYAVPGPERIPRDSTLTTASVDGDVAVAEKVGTGMSVGVGNKMGMGMSVAVGNRTGTGMSVAATVAGMGAEVG